jgi:ankyrin repeat protein
LQALLDGGADPCHLSAQYASAIRMAVEQGCLDACRALVTASAGAALTLRHKNGRTPLIMACGSRQRAVVELLCALGADVNDRDDEGNTALRTAAL